MAIVCLGGIGIFNVLLMAVRLFMFTTSHNISYVYSLVAKNI